ncbi:MAG: hypothetical protein KDK60_04325 [Chlamydiia bacterium]|nr:hypothetical protein [Chlamydiia bacterium]
MDIKSDPQVGARSAAEGKKEEKTLPKRSFKEVMRRSDFPTFPKRRDSVFDLASKGKKKEVEKRKDPEVVAPAPMQGEVAVEESAPLAEVKEISLETLDFIEQMANYIKIESDNGISSTTIKVSLGDSVLDGCEIHIDHYDTAPHSFNLQLMGSPEAVDLMNAQLSALQTSLNTHEALKGFQVHLFRPILSEKSELFRRGQRRSEKRKEAKVKKIPS